MSVREVINRKRKSRIQIRKILTKQIRDVTIEFVASGGHGSIAQLGEHLPYKQRVIGSSPIVPTINGPVAQFG